MMQKLMSSRFLNVLAICGLCFFVAPMNAQANSGGGGGEGGGVSYEKLEDFTVNLAGMKQMIQVTFTLKPAKPEAGPKVKLYMPVIRHHLILLLSGKTGEQLQTLAGKEQLIKEVRVVINKAIQLDSKEGIAEVLMEKIIIQ
jgi:flagellar FliL protein